jgi:N utilization substance protein B
MNNEENELSSAEESSSDAFIQATLTQRDYRALVFHLLYAMDAFDYQVSLESIVDNFNRGFGTSIETSGLVFQEAQHIIEKREELDSDLMPLLANWRFDRLGVSTRLILRLGLWELLYTSIDTLIVLNEAIELGKIFAEKDAYKFINGVLDEAVKRYKATEQPVAS